MFDGLYQAFMVVVEMDSMIVVQYSICFNHHNHVKTMRFKSQNHEKLEVSETMGGQSSK